MTLVDFVFTVLTRGASHVYTESNIFSLLERERLRKSKDTIYMVGKLYIYRFVGEVAKTCLFFFSSQNPKPGSLIKKLMKKNMNTENPITKKLA